MSLKESLEKNWFWIRLVNLSDKSSIRERWPHILAEEWENISFGQSCLEFAQFYLGSIHIWSVLSLTWGKTRGCRSSRTRHRGLLSLRGHIVVGAGTLRNLAICNLDVCLLFNCHQTVQINDKCSSPLASYVYYTLCSSTAYKTYLNKHKLFTTTTNLLHSWWIFFWSGPLESAAWQLAGWGYRY